MLRRWTDTPVRRNGAAVGTAGEHLPIFTALNGVRRGGLRPSVLSARVRRLRAWMPVVHLAPGEVIIRSTPRSGDAAYRAGAQDRRQTMIMFLHRISRRPYWRPTSMCRPRTMIMAEVSQVDQQHRGNVFQALVARNGDWRPLVAAAEAEARRVLDAVGISIRQARPRRPPPARRGFHR